MCGLKTMTYEEYLDEVTTLIYERYNLSEADAIAAVMRAQDDEFFVRHDDEPALRTQAQADEDARTVFRKYGA